MSAAAGQSSTEPHANGPLGWPRIYALIKRRKRKAYLAHAINVQCNEDVIIVPRLGIEGRAQKSQLPAAVAGASQRQSLV